MLSKAKEMQFEIESPITAPMVPPNPKAPVNHNVAIKSIANFQSCVNATVKLVRKCKHSMVVVNGFLPLGGFNALIE